MFPSSLAKKWEMTSGDSTFKKWETSEIIYSQDCPFKNMIKGWALVTIKYTISIKTVDFQIKIDFL